MIEKSDAIAKMTDWVEQQSPARDPRPAQGDSQDPKVVQDAGDDDNGGRNQTVELTGLARLRVLMWIRTVL